MDCRAQRRRTLWDVCGVQLSEDETGGRPAANRGANRSKRAAFWTIDVMEPTGLARETRGLARDSDRESAVVCGTYLLAGGAESDAGVASGCAGAARSASVRTYF